MVNIIFKKISITEGYGNLTVQIRVISPWIYIVTNARFPPCDLITIAMTVKTMTIAIVATWSDHNYLMINLTDSYTL